MRISKYLHKIGIILLESDNNMKKNTIIKILVLPLIVGIFILMIINYNNYKVSHAKKIVELKKKEIEVYDKVKLKDIIKNINGKIEKNIIIDTSKLGKKEIHFTYINDDNIKIPYQISIKVVDKTPPIIQSLSTYTIVTNTKTKKEFEKSLFCGDNYDDKPSCRIEGEYSLSEIGDYNLTFIGEDSSKNVAKQSFTLKVVEKEEKNEKNEKHITTPISNIIKKYKTKNNKIGIDISHWQGKIDYKKVKKSGVEFAYIRVGRGDGIGKEAILDDKFEEYIEGFEKEKIPIGIYFYSDANNDSTAKKEAKWIIDKIKNHKIDLEIVFDWENWSNYQEYQMSFHKLSTTANTFIREIEKSGYQGMVYSSKYYLENIWKILNQRIWLAHYTEQTDYKGNYKVWQICNNGEVPGIENLTDIDILYNN